MDYDELISRYLYNPSTGVFTRKIGVRGHAAGGNVGYVQNNGYRVIHFMGRPHGEHRLAWLYVYGEWPKDQIDHINKNKEDNRISNLRSCDGFTNHKNKKLLISNKYGIPGVRIKRGKWEANIRPDNKYIHLGTFADYFEACCARKAAEQQYNFHVNHGRTV